MVGSSTAKILTPPSGRSGRGCSRAWCGRPPDRQQRYGRWPSWPRSAEHVTVNEGGQAIVGNVATGGEGRRKRRRQPHERDLSLPEKPALHGHIEADTPALSGPGRHGLDPMPLSWRAGRSAEGQAESHVSPRAMHARGGRLEPSPHRSPAGITRPASTADAVMLALSPLSPTDIDGRYGALAEMLRRSATLHIGVPIYAAAFRRDS